MTEDLPRTIENPITGERVTFLATAEETNGEYVRIRYETPAGAPGVVMHYHLAYTGRSRCSREGWTCAWAPRRTT
jgi:hypothetical protein